jgi:Leucine-rich repeat (LRR) protein
MNKLLAAMFVALLMAGCGEDIGIPKMIDCDGCGGEVYSGAKDCPKCAYPVADSIDVYVKTWKEERVKAWQEWEANPEPYGGAEVLARIKQAEEEGATELKISSCTLASESDFTSIPISDISPLAGLTKLRVLNLSDNNISDITPLAGLTNLEELDLGRNEITDLTPLKELTNLERLNLHINQISNIMPLAGLTNLELLHLGGGETEISDLTPLAGLTNLEELELTSSKISDITPLKELTDLRVLNLWNNNISDITPLKGLTKLDALYLQFNKITYYLSSLPPELTRLDIGNNKITDLRDLPTICPNLESLFLKGISIPEEQKAMLRKALPDCDISF